MIRSAVLLIFVVAALAQRNAFLPPGETDFPFSRTINDDKRPLTWVTVDNVTRRCDTEGYTYIDKSSFYKKGFKGTTAICVKSYLAACATVNGLELCNTFNSQCASVDYDIGDSVQYPRAFKNMVQRPEICTDSGMYQNSREKGFRHPDTSVLLIAQIIVSATVLFTAYGFFVLQSEVSTTFKALLGIFFVDCILLLFGYFYLNSILIFATALAASLSFSMKSDAAAAVGFGLVLTTLYWTTFESGLGNVQHQSRFTAGGVTTDAYERMCNNYFRGYFFWPSEQHKEVDNIAVSFWGLCDREWVAAQLFFMIFAQQLLVVLIAAGSWVRFSEPREGEDGYVREVSLAQPQQ